MEVVGLKMSLYLREYHTLQEGVRYIAVVLLIICDGLSRMT